MKRKFVISVLIAGFCSWKTTAQSLHNDIALLAATEIIPVAFSGKPTETAWPHTTHSELEDCLKARQKTKFVLGLSKQYRPVEVYYFPGTSNERALVIGGMHGSELSSIELAQNIIRLLSNGANQFYDVLVIPSLFPDNAFSARVNTGHKKAVNAGRYTTAASVDPNRQMPALGKEFDEENPCDFNGRLIEPENRYLLQLIQEFKPSRIANLHAIRDITKAGIFADPRTDCKGLAIGFESDSLFAVSIANHICKNGGWVPGNYLQTAPTALYYNDPLIAAPGFFQKRNLHGSPLPHNRGHGVSLGGWATTAVCNEKNSLVREAMRLITVEFPGYQPSSAYTDSIQKEQCLLNIQLYSTALIAVFFTDPQKETAAVINP